LRDASYASYNDFSWDPFVVCGREVLSISGLLAFSDLKCFKFYLCFSLIAVAFFFISILAAISRYRLAKASSTFLSINAAFDC
jgi:hypothetical protein